jgi:hypothetical protein
LCISITSWFEFAFFWWLNMFNIFSCALRHSHFFSGEVSVWIVWLFKNICIDVSFTIDFSFFCGTGVWTQGFAFEFKSKAGAHSTAWATSPVLTVEFSKSSLSSLLPFLLLSFSIPLSFSLYREYSFLQICGFYFFSS